MRINIIKEFFNTISFLTILPIYKKSEPSYFLYLFFPIVGLLIGVMCVCFFRVMNLIFAKELGILFMFIFYIFLADYLHLDGFTDTIDASYGFLTNKDPKEILKDPHIGAVGVLFLVLILLLKFTLLKNIQSFYNAILVSTTISRWCMSVAGFYGIPLENSNIAKKFIYRDVRILVGSFCLSFVICLIFLSNVLILSIIFFSSYLLVLSITKFFNHKFGGINGDVIGFCSEVVEVLVLITFSLGGEKI